MKSRGKETAHLAPYSVGAAFCLASLAAAPVRNWEGGSPTIRLKATEEEKALA